MKSVTELLTAAQMRAIEQAAIASGEVTGLELMERAGRGVVEAVFEEWPELGDGSHHAVVLCGPGNNGGDGFVVARLLKEVGWNVEVFLYGDAEKLPPDARVNYERWGGSESVRALDNSTSASAFKSDVVVDAVFGTGLRRPIKGVVAAAFVSMQVDGDLCIAQPDVPRFVSVDVPSGFCADSGRILGMAAPSHLVVSFHRAKIGLYLSEAAALCQRIVVSDIGLTISDFPQQTFIVPPVRRHNLNAYWQGNYLGKDQTPRAPYSLSLHKYSHGHAVILSGGVGKGGAARLAARGALRVGAGAVTLGCPPAALIENAAQLNAVMLRSVTGVDDLSSVLGDPRINALCLGPGMGMGGREALILAAVLDLTRPGLDPGRGVVLDADALTLLARDAQLFAKLHDRCMLTPHAGEFARLFPDIAEKLNAPATKGPAYSKADATRDAARRAGCVVLLKGPDTVIADPRGRCSINASVYERAAPWLATAGSGDVLAGLITGLLARGFAPMQAAETGAWLHTECGLSFGPGLIAEDLPEELPKVFRALGI